MTIRRIGVVGHHTWFSNHFPENWESDPHVLCLDVDESDYRFLVYMINFRPDVTLFYRPELYPKQLVQQIPGKKIAFLSEPLPYLKDGALQSSDETNLRLKVYGGMQWESFDDILYYDSGKRATVEVLGWPVTAFRPLPIDTRRFRPGAGSRPIDICFLGKATPRRVAAMDFLRLQKWRFVWVAHGLTGNQLAALFRRSKIVLNIHADAIPAMEPRVHLAAACGCVVLSEPIAADVTPFEDHVLQYDGELGAADIRRALDVFRVRSTAWQKSLEHLALSTRRLIDERVSLLQGRSRNPLLRPSRDARQNAMFGL